MPSLHLVVNWPRLVCTIGRSRAQEFVGRACVRRPVWIVGQGEENAFPPGAQLLPEHIAAPSGVVALATYPEQTSGPQNEFTWQRAARLIPVEVGMRDGEPVAAHAPNEAALDRLLDLKPGGGMEQALCIVNEVAIRERLLARYRDAVEALNGYKEAYVFGAGRLGALVIQGLRKLGVKAALCLDNDPNRAGSEVAGCAVAQFQQASRKELPVILASTRYPRTFARQARAEGFTRILPYPLLTLLDPCAFPPEIPYKDIYPDIAENIPALLSEFLNYRDDRSREVLDALLAYRLSLDPETLASVADEPAAQYFALPLSSEEVFVDAGGFDGSTTLEFIGRCGGRYRRIYYVEPDPGLMSRSQTALAGHDRIDFVQGAVSSHDGEASFATTGAVHGAIADAGDLKVAVHRIDSLVQEATTFIKMDIEGSEGDALLGAEDQIRRNAPKLAVVVYHQGSDLWRLARIIRQLNPVYNFSLRHYSESGLETVLYAYKGELELT